MLRIDSDGDLTVLLRAVSLALGERHTALEGGSDVAAEIETLQAMQDRLDLIQRTKHYNRRHHGIR